MTILQIIPFAQISPMVQCGEPGGVTVNYDVRFSETERQVMIAVRGELTISGIAEYIRKTLADPRWRPGMNVLFDYRRVDVDKLSGEDIEHMADLVVAHKDEHRGSRLAMVMDNDLSFGLARMWQSQVGEAGSLEASLVTHSMSEALEWLKMARFDQSVTEERSP